MAEHTNAGGRELDLTNEPASGEVRVPQVGPPWDNEPPDTKATETLDLTKEPGQPVREPMEGKPYDPQRAMDETRRLIVGGTFGLAILTILAMLLASDERAKLITTSAFPLVMLLCTGVSGFYFGKGQSDGGRKGSG